MTRSDAESVADAVTEISNRIVIPPLGSLRARRRQRQRSRVGSVVAIGLLSLGATLAAVEFDRSSDEGITTTVGLDEADPTLEASQPPTSESEADPLAESLGDESPELDPGAERPDTEPTTPEPARLVLNSSDSEPTSFAYVADGANVFLVDGTEATMVFALEESEYAADPSETELPPSTIESVAPGPASMLLVGICCEPAAGLTLSVALDGSLVERLPIDGSFPAVNSEATSIVSADGYALRLVELEVEKSEVSTATFLLEGLGGELPRSEWIENRAVVLSVNNRIMALRTDGTTIAERELPVRSVVYDELNRVLLALEDSDSDSMPSSLLVLSPETLDTIAEVELNHWVSEIDVMSGWLLYIGGSGEVHVAPLADPSAATAVATTGTIDTFSWLSAD